MDPRRQSRDSLSYSKLFNLESLMNFKLPQHHDDFDYYGNSGQNESRGSQGGAMANHGNRTMSEERLSFSKRERRSYNSERKGAHDKQTASKPRNSQKTGEAMDYEMDDLQFEKTKRPKRPKKSMNETPELTFAAAALAVSQQTQFPPRNEFSPGDFGAAVEQ